MDSEMNNNEFNEMRRQLALLKDKLNRQQIVNEQLVRDAVKGKINDLTRMRRSKRIMLCGCIIFVPVILIKVIGLPVWFAAVTALFFIVALAYNEYYMEGIDSHNLSSGGLLQVSQKAARLQRQTRRWLFVGIPLLLVWMLLFCYLINNYTWFLIADNEIVTGLLTGLFVGSLLGYIMYRRQQRMVDDLQAAIREMQEQ